ncbi:MAG: hypothetical protein L0G81_03805 [Ewingella sp.]|nr:hypothetical protein [Ewingella sp.]
MDTLRHSRSTPAHWLEIVQSGPSIYQPLSHSLRLNDPNSAAKNLFSSFTPPWRMR